MLLLDLLSYCVCRIQTVLIFVLFVYYKLFGFTSKLYLVVFKPVLVSWIPPIYIWWSRFGVMRLWCISCCTSYMFQLCLRSIIRSTSTSNCFWSALIKCKEGRCQVWLLDFWADFLIQNVCSTTVCFLGWSTCWGWCDTFSELTLRPNRFALKRCLSLLVNWLFDRVNGHGLFQKPDELLRKLLA